MDSGVTEFHLTGFSKFAGVADNPTEKLVNLVRAGALKHVENSGWVRIGSMRVWETSAKFTTDAVARLHERFAPQNGSRVVFIHLGVHRSANGFRLESCGVNEANFGVPDEQGFMPVSAPVLPHTGGTRKVLATSLPVNDLVARLKARGIVATKSTNAGRFVCNWTYYTSLHYSRQSGVAVLFVHVPSEEQMPLAEQVKALAELMQTIAATEVLVPPTDYQSVPGVAAAVV
mmetsp:Transcript_2527/g.7562  ORF Transcript_2527/g.7562 Transcript_2527/m.7562 type:complete len:231 (-) Transcript_2527:1076-1768(-)